MDRDQPSLIPPGVTSGSKEVRAHVVIYAVNLPTFSAEKIDDFRANEARRTSYEKCLLHKTFDFVSSEGELALDPNVSLAKYAAAFIIPRVREESFPSESSEESSQEVKTRR